MHPLVGDWPLFGLRVRCGDVELRLPDESDLAALAEIARAGVHDSAHMPFTVPWTDAEPDDRARGVLQYHWGRWATWSPTKWFLELAVVRAGTVVGVQAMRADEFAVRRGVATGSYLGRPYQGQGTGKVMRRAILHLAFAGLGATEARSEALDGNPASHAVSRALGYMEDGTEVHSPRGVAVTGTRYLLTREQWEQSDRVPTEIEGLEPCLPLFGIG